MKKIAISVIIIAGEEEHNISGCLESVVWADDIIVVNSFSKDKTAEISKKFTDRVFLKEWEGYAKQKAFSLSLAKNEWVLSLDADERCTEEVKSSILNILTNPSENMGYYIARRNYFLGKWIKSCGWYPGYQLRFFKKEKTRLTDRKVHEGFIVDGKVGYLKGDIVHNTHPNVEYIIKKINEYSSLQAEEKYFKKKAYWFNIIINPVIAFFQHFILRRGFIDGVYGFLVSLIHALTNMFTYIKIWEKQHIANPKN